MNIIYKRKELINMSMFEKINKVVDERYLHKDFIALYDKDGVLEHFTYEIEVY